MIETINRAEFIDMLANDHNLSKTEAKEMYEKFISTHKRALLSGKRVLVGDLYRVQGVVRKGGKRRIPRTGEQVEVADRARIKLIAGTAFEQELTEAIVK